MARVLLVNKIELAITMFETQTALIVSSITLERTPNGGAEISGYFSEHIHATAGQSTG